MYCPKCGTANDDQAAFCKQCGTNLKPAGGVAPTIVPVAVSYAGFWKRFAAFIIDAIVLGIVGSIIRVFFGFAFLGNSRVGVTILLTSPISIVIGWLYYSLMESSVIQGTLGKMALTIKVTDIEGKRIMFGKATGRYFAKILSAIIIFIGFIMIAFTKKKQGLHDILANTLVVTK